MLCGAVKILFASKVKLSCKVKGRCVPKVTIETRYLFVVVVVVVFVVSASSGKLLRTIHTYRAVPMPCR